MKNKQNLGWIIAGILLLIILLAIGYLMELKTEQEFYQLGFQEGQLNIIQGITQTGTIPYLVYNQESNSTSIQTTNIKEICGGKE